MEDSLWDIKSARQYMASLLPKLQKEAAKGRWIGIAPEHFNYSTRLWEEDIIYALGLEFYFQDVAGILIEVEMVVCEPDYCIKFCYYTVFNTEDIKPAILHKLFELNQKFLDTLSFNNEFSMKNDGFFIEIFIPRVENVFQTFCDQLDEFIPRFNQFNFQLPIPSHTELPIGTQAMVKTLEDKLGAPFQLITEEDSINKKLKTGYFKTFNK